MTKLPVLLVAAGLVAAGSATAAAPGAGRTHQATAVHQAAAKANVQQVALTVRPNGRGGEVVSPSDGNIAIAPGIPVRVTITNFTHEYHTITIPGLHTGAMVLPARGHTARRTTFTFTAWEGGAFKWFCVFCAHGGPGHRDHMGGTVYALIDPSVVS